MAGVMGGMMGAMLGVMLQFPPEHALATGIILLGAQWLALLAVAHLVRRTCALNVALPDYYEALALSPPATPRDVAAAYLRVIDAPEPPSAERLRLADEALAVLSDPLRRLPYERARASLRTASSLGEAGPETQAVDTRWAPFRRWGTVPLIGVAIIGVSYAANRPVTCPPPAAASGLPALPAAGASEKQWVNLTIQYPCYYPDRITVQRGIPVAINIGTVGEPGCGRQVIVRGLGLNTIVSPGQIKTLEFVPEQAGTYTVNCGMNMMKTALLTVTE
jgi:hypothetical protein